MCGRSDGLSDGHVGVGSPRLQYLASDGVVLELDAAPRNVELGTGGPHVVPVSGAQGEPVRKPHQREPAAQAVPATDHELALIHQVSVAPALADRPESGLVSGRSGCFARPRANIHPVPRPLTARERDILDLLLSVEFPGAGELREQARSVTAEREGMVFDLVVQESVPRATVVGRTPVQAVVDGDGYDGGVLLFVEDGRLSALEYWWVTEEKPELFPPLSAVGQPIASA